MSLTTPTSPALNTGFGGTINDLPSGTPPPPGGDGRPPMAKYMSAPGAYQSPLRHHKRAASSTRHVKETLNARSEYSNSEDDGTAQHRINQYLIKQEIGRGSFGAVHLAVDQFGQEYAVKEFSKSRLRKRAQSNLLRRPSRRRPGALAAALHRNSTLDENNTLDLIKEEIAIMKKLNHPNLVSLIEVLDDPEEDSLYMVMEMCKKGVVMRVSLEERADPYDDEQCRCWFRDLILGIEYLHAQGIIHRDLKPDNCLITDDDVLKIVDFGVSEMFEKESDMLTTKSAGSPAFMPPELCVPKHGAVSGRACDIWSMGVTLYCLRFGRLPFEKLGMLELFESIREEDLQIDDDCDPDLRDLLIKILTKDPERRINMDEIREHPWVTRHGTDPLLPKSENVAVLVEPPTDAEVNAAITGNMGHLVTVVRAVRRFKQLLFKRRPDLMQGILGNASRLVQPPLSMRPMHLRKTKSDNGSQRSSMEGALAAGGVHHEVELSEDGKVIPMPMQDGLVTGPPAGKNARAKSPVTFAPYPEHINDSKLIHEYGRPRPDPATEPISIPGSVKSGSRIGSPAPVGKGHAHNPLEDTLFLYIGPGSETSEDTSLIPDAIPVVSESPSNADMDVYEAAYQEEIQRILNRKNEGGRRPTLYLTKRVEDIKSLRDNEAIFDAAREAGRQGKAEIAKLVDRAKKEANEQSQKDGLVGRGIRGLRDLKNAVSEAGAEGGDGPAVEGDGAVPAKDTGVPRSADGVGEQEKVTGTV